MIRSKFRKFTEISTKDLQKTFIDPKFLKYTREFSDEEIKDWKKEDAF